MKAHPRSAFGASPSRGRPQRPGKAGSAAALVLACALFGAAAQGHAQAPDDAAERARIAAERGAAESRHAEAQKACRAKFAVNDCLDQARREHNAIESGLRRQERVLNDAERKRKAAEKQRELDERNSPERQQAAAERRARAVEEQQERQADADEKRAKRAADDAERAQHGPRVKTPDAAPGPQGSPREPHGPKSNAPTPEEAAKNRAAHEQRVREAQEHKAQVADRNAKRTKPVSPDLPLPPR